MVFALIASIVLVPALMIGISSVSGDRWAKPAGLTANKPLIPNVPASLELPPPDGRLISAQDAYTLCLAIYTGTIRSRFIISNPGGVSGFSEYHLVNFDQRLLSQSSTALDIEIISRRYVDTHAPYPVNIGMLPGDVQNYLLPEPGWIQSDDPEIAAKAHELASGARTQAEAVDAIQAWVRGNIAYDYTFSLPADASSVFRNRSGVCAGFSTLTVAFLRAAGIPARYHRGCVAKWGWVVGDEGGWHAWIETYFPDVGWVASDPQTTANFVDTSHIFAGFNQCGQVGTMITRTSHQEDDGYLYSLRTIYANSPWPSLSVVYIPAWDRHPLKVMPNSPAIMLSVADPLGSLGLRVENLSCECQDWQVRTEASWLTPTVVTGDTAGIALFTVDGSGMDLGFYSSPMTAYATSSPWGWGQALSRTITASLWLVDVVHHYYLPVVMKEK